MMVDQKRQFEVVKASQIFQRYDPDPETVALAAHSDKAVKDNPLDDNPHSVFEQLVEANRFAAAVDFLSYWLTPQQLVWWGCLCVWEIERERDSEQVHAALKSIIDWLQNPDEASRQAIRKLDPSMPSSHPVSFLCKAATFSSGSICDPHLPDVLPPEFLYSKFGSCAIQLVAVAAKPEQLVSNQKQVLRLGAEVLQGTNHWQIRGNRSA